MNWHAPGDVLGARLTARQRRTIAAWTLIVFVLLTPLLYVWKDAVWMIWLLSIAAIWISLLTVVAAETPVEQEDPDA